jgi:hypothetical protein
VFAAGGETTDHDGGDDEQRSFDFDARDPIEVGEPPPRGARREVGTPAFVHGRPETTLPDADLPPEPAFTAPRTPSGREAEMTPSRGISGLRLGLRFEALVLVLFCGIGLYLAANPQRIGSLAAGIPGFDAAVGTADHPVSHIGIADVAGSAEMLRGERPGFIIRGRVINNLDRPVGSIQIEGRIYGPAGEVARKTVYAGTKVSLRLVRSWTPAAIEMFEKIKPPKRYRLAPGDDDDFLIVFQDVPPDLTEFACKVAGAYPVVGR